MNLLKSIFGTDIENPADRVALWICFVFALAILALVIFAAESVPAQEKPIPQKTDAATVEKASVGDVLVRKENFEIRKGDKGKFESKIYAAPQWDATGKALLSYNDVTGKTTVRGRYVRYTPDEATAKLAVTRTKGNAAVKEFWTVPDASVSRLAWTIDSDAPQVAFKDATIRYLDSQGMEIFHTPAPVAWDSEKNPVGIAVTFDKGTLTYEIVGDKYTYPVTVDPSVLISTIGARDGTRYRQDNSWSIARDTTNAVATNANIHVFGDSINATTVLVGRAFVTFPLKGILANVKTVDACSLYVYGDNDNTGANDYVIYLVGANAYRPVLDLDDYSKFNGRTTGAPHTGTKLANDWNTSTYSATWNKFIFNQAGLDSVTNTVNDSLAICFLSQSDYTNTKLVTTGIEYAGFFGSGKPGKEPYLSISYTSSPPSGLTRTVIYNKEPNYLWKTGTTVPIWKPGS